MSQTGCTRNVARNVLNDNNGDVVLSIRDIQFIEENEEDRNYYYDRFTVIEDAEDAEDEEDRREDRREAMRERAREHRANDRR
jgi:hypothetical protein